MPQHEGQKDDIGKKGQEKDAATCVERRRLCRGIQKGMPGHARRRKFQNLKGYAPDMGLNTPSMLQHTPCVLKILGFLFNKLF